MLSAAGYAVIALYTAYEVKTRIEAQQLDADYAIYVHFGVPVAVIVLLGLIGLWVFNRPNIVEFLIATDAEMRKVNWPTRREIIGSTWVVICGTFLMAALLFVVDVLFVTLFSSIGILDAESLLQRLIAALSS